MKKGDVIGLYMKDGYLCAGKKPRSATATVYADAKKNNDVGIFDVVGIIDHHEGVINVCIVPRIQRGGSLKVRRDKLKKIVAMAGLVAAVGIESSIALKSIGRNPDLFFGASEGVIDAAYHGITCAIVIVDDESANLVKRLENTPLESRGPTILILPEESIRYIDPPPFQKKDCHIRPFFGLSRGRMGKQGGENSLDSRVFDGP